MLEIATESHTHEMLKPDEIDKLCECVAGE